MLKKIVGFLAFAMTILSFGAYIGLIKDGGARDQGLDNAIPYNGPLNALPIVWGGVTLAVVFFVWIVCRFKIRPHWALLGLGTLSICSALWAEVPKASLGAALLLIAAYLLVATHIKLAGWDGTIRAAIKGFLIFELSSFIYIFLIPHYGVAVGEHLGKWQGIFTHKNSLGSFAALAFSISFWYWLISKNKFAALSAVLAAILTIGSQSTTAIGIVVVLFLFNSACTFSFIRKFIYRYRLLILLGLLLLSAFAVYAAIALGMDSPDEKYATFSNRNVIWLYIFAKVAASPIWGYGLDQLSVANSLDGSDFTSQVGFLVASAHNGFIETLYSLGLCGEVIVFLLITVFVKNLKNNQTFTLFFGYMFIFILENTFESRMVSFNSHFIVFLYLFEISAAMNGEVVRRSLTKTSAPVYLRAS
jgi:exopolysaccharide production protein ExoQ